MDFPEKFRGIASIEDKTDYQEYLYHFMRPHREQVLEHRFMKLKAACDEMAKSEVCFPPTILIHGPRWVGKTLMVRRLSWLMDVPVIRVHSQCLLAVPIEKALEILALAFSIARNERSILCLEDIDLLCAGYHRSQNNRQFVLSNLFKDEMTRLNSTSTVIGTTKNIDTVRVESEIYPLFTLVEELSFFNCEDSCALAQSVCHSAGLPMEETTELVSDLGLEETQKYAPKTIVRLTLAQLTRYL